MCCVQKTDGGCLAALSTSRVRTVVCKSEPSEPIRRSAGNNETFGKAVQNDRRQLGACILFINTSDGKEKDMDSGITRIVSHDATDMELQEFTIPSQERRLDASSAGARVRDGRHEIGKRHAVFYHSPIPTSVTSHSPPIFSFKPINFSLTSNRQMANPYCSRILHPHLHLLRFELRLRYLPRTVFLAILHTRISVP